MKTHMKPTQKLNPEFEMHVFLRTIFLLRRTVLHRGPEPLPRKWPPEAGRGSYGSVHPDDLGELTEKVLIPSRETRNPHTNQGLLKTVVLVQCPRSRLRDSVE